MINTKRLVIKSLLNDDDGQLAKLLDDPAILRATHLTFSSQPVTSFELNLLLKSVNAYGIYRRQSPQTLCGLLTLDKTAELPGGFELGYLLQQKLWGKGLMTEAVAGLLETVTVPLIAFTDRTNYRSQHVLQKNGFILVGQDNPQLRWQKPACTVK
ncbi:GNAT family N-acetyltransferase [Limosilactobacillus sp.]|uniref:GNAT family N-acetyltransferase n=1 Tax=Limosilactobacillus sp. TaxID=2773925 RepID=UPI003F0EA9CF